MKRYLILGTAMLLGAAVTVVAQTTTKTLFDRFPQAEWVCGGFEADTKVTVGAHNDVILFADIPATNEHDRKICLLVDKDSNSVEAPMQNLRTR